MDSLPKPCPKKRSKDYIPRHAPLPILDERLQTDESVSNKRKCHIGHLEEGCVLVKDRESMKILYCKGFFGKGTLSRGGPRVCYPRQSKGNALTVKSEANPAVQGCSEDDRCEESERPLNVHEIESSDESDGCELFSDETLQLTFMEAYFLSYGLGCLVVMDQNKPLGLLTLWQKFCTLTPDDQFPYLYTAYHHFRSKGWVVRSGVKYGTDFLLYKEGPCYYHSSFAVIVKPTLEKNLMEIPNEHKLPLTWSGLSAKNRLLSHVAKVLLFLYVIRPDNMDESNLASPTCISEFKVEEVFVKRWVPSSNREDDED